MSTTKNTEPDVASDEYMIRRGYRKASAQERAEFGKFVNREGWVSAVSGAIVRWAISHHHRAADRGTVEVVSAWQTEGSNPLPSHPKQHSPRTLQNEATPTAVFPEQSGEY